MTAIERAARALHRRRMEGQHPKPDNYPWEDLSRREQAILRADAYAVINAIREPDDAMVAKVHNEGLWNSAQDETRSIYTAMIDAILEERNA